MNFVKLIFSVAALVLAIVFTYVIPGHGFEEMAVTIGASIAYQFGIVKWRADYTMFKSWLASKTIWGALLVIIPTILVALNTAFAWDFPQAVISILIGISMVGGGFQLYGMYDAHQKDGGE